MAASLFGEAQCATELCFRRMRLPHYGIVLLLVIELHRIHATQTPGGLFFHRERNGLCAQT